MSPKTPNSPNRSYQEPVSTVKRHKQFANIFKLFNTAIIGIFYKLVEATLKHSPYANIKILTIVLQGLEAAAFYIKYPPAQKKPASRNTLIQYYKYNIKYIQYSGNIKF